MDFKGLKNTRKIASVLALVGLLIAISLSSTSELTGEFLTSNTLNGEQQPESATVSEASTTSSNIQNGLQAYYRLDNVKASKGHSLEFDGSDDYISIPENSDNTISSDFTASGWLKVDESGTYDSHTLIQKNSNYGLLFDGGPRIFLEVWDEGSSRHKFYSGNISDSINSWTHYAYTVDENNSVKLFMNGSLVDSWSIGFNVSDAGSNSVLIGKRNSNIYYTDGSIDNARLYKRALSSTEINNLYKGLPVSSNNLVLYHRFNEGPENCDLTSSNTCIKDDSANSNDATPYNLNDNNIDTRSGWTSKIPINRPSGTDSSTNRNKVFFQGGNDGSLDGFDFNVSSGWTENGFYGDKALHFDGSNDYVAVNNSPTKFGTESFSVAFRVKTEYSSKQGYFSKRSECNASPFIDIRGTGEITAVLHSGSQNNQVNSASHINDGSPHQIIFVRNYDELQLYVDGELEATSPNEGLNISNNAKIGFGTSACDDTGFMSGSDDGTSSFNGTMDDVRIYSEALSQEQVKALYNRKPVNKGLIGRWNFESGDGKTAYDTSYKTSGVLGSSSVNSEPETYGVGSSVSFNESSVSAWYRKGDLPEKVSSIGRSFATYCLLDTSDNQGLFSIGSTHDGNFVKIQNLSSSGDTVHTWTKSLDRGQLWRFPCDDYGPDSAFRVTSEYPVSVDYDSMLDARTSDDDWTSRSGENIWYSMPNDNNEMSITAYRNNTQVTLYNRTAGTSQSFTLDAKEYWTCSDCTDQPSLFNVRTNEDHPVTVLYGKFDDNSGSEIVAPTRKLYRVSKDYAENGQTIHIVAEKDSTDVEVIDYAGNCTSTSTTLNAGEVYSDSCGQGTINLKVNSSKPVSMTLIEASGNYGPSMYRSSSNNWGIGKEYSITSSNAEGTSIAIISLAENNQIDISGAFSYSAELDKYENRYGIGNLPVNEHLKIDAEHPVAVIGDAGSNYEAAMAVLPLPKANVAKAGQTGIGVSKDRVFGFNSGNVVSTEGLQTDQWQNLAVTGGSNTSLYIDGRKALTADIPSNNESGDVMIGRAEGQIDEVRVYNQTLTDSAVQDLLFQ